MSGSYFSPFRRRGALQFDEESRPSTPQSDRSASSGQGHGGYRDCERRFAYQNPEVDQPDLYHELDIHYHYCGDRADPRVSQGSTFHDAKCRPDELSYMLLFSGANPHWKSDHIVFVKSKLALLPEYAAKKAEHGEWETEAKKIEVKEIEAKTHESTGEVTESVEDSELKDWEVITVPDEPKPEAAGETTLEEVQPPAGSLKFQISSPVRVTRPKNIKPESLQERDRLLGAQWNGFFIVDNGDSRYRIYNPNDKLVHLVPASWCSMPPLSVKGSEFASQESTTGGKREEQRAGVNIKGGASHEGRATPIPAPSSTTATSCLKHKDIRKEEAQPTPTANQPTPPGSLLNYSDTGPYRPSSRFPPITPIDYVPANPQPVAIFEERRGLGSRMEADPARFAFKGWFKVSRVNILAPRSAELVHMLQKKWEERKRRLGFTTRSKSRDPAAWEAALGREWAVVRFELVEGEGAPLPPQIERSPVFKRSEGETKGVTEMLSGMRVGDCNTGGQKGKEPAGGCGGEAK
ncbi:hypothetical protein ANO14919_058540 [Xylariales sp. No.14919]|nr:hypothetical protein ANO14919_058540 [Xylariales sp. No.14919]